VNHRVVIADGAMGAMLQGRELSLEDDFLGLEGCNEILNATRPDVLADIHDAYFAVGIDAVETNTFGANWSNLSDYGIDDRIEELARKRAEIARERAEAAEKTGGRMRWVRAPSSPAPATPATTTSSRRSPCRPRASSTGERMPTNINGAIPASDGGWSAL
jgi:5-methyltetrahydrofolate--homocysteine methyltransferase